MPAHNLGMAQESQRFSEQRNWVLLQRKGLCTVCLIPMGNSLDTDEILSEGPLLQVCFYYRCPQPSPLIWSLLTGLLGAVSQFCASPRGKSQLRSGIHGTLLLPLLPCPWDATDPTVERTRVSFVLHPYPLAPVTAVSCHLWGLDSRQNDISFCDMKTLAPCLQILHHNTDVPLGGPKIIF